MTAAATTCGWSLATDNSGMARGTAPQLDFRSHVFLEKDGTTLCLGWDASVSAIPCISAQT